MSKLCLNIKYIWNIIKQKFSSYRFFTFALLMSFILWVYISPIREFCIEMNYHVSPWTLFIVSTDSYFQVIFIFLIIYYFSDIPFMNCSEMYSTIRTGRIKWALGKIISIIIVSFSILLLIFFISLIPLIGQLQFENDWGKIIYTLCTVNVSLDTMLPFKYDIVSIYTPLQAFFTLFTICGLLISFMGLLMYCISILFSRMCAICCIFLITVFGIVANNIMPLHHSILYISPISWIDLNNLALDSGHTLPTFTYVVTVLISSIIILSIIILVRVKTINFEWNKED